MADSRTMADFNRDLEDGDRWADFAQAVLWDNGIACFPHRSRHYQWRLGESRQGIEFKHDHKFRSTSNLFVETEERRTTDGTSHWRPAGIYDEPMTPRLYCIGDYVTIYLLPVRFLRVCAEAGKFGKLVTNGTNTGKGYLVPLAWTTKFAVAIFDCGDEVLP